MTFEEKQEIYKKYFSLNFFGNDISNKFALISLTCYLVSKLRLKNPKVTPLAVLNKLNSSNIPSDILESLAVICEEFGYGCSDFPTFDLKDKDIPAKIKDLLMEYLPF